MVTEFNVGSDSIAGTLVFLFIALIMYLRIQERINDLVKCVKQLQNDFAKATKQRRVLQYTVSKHNKPELSLFLYLLMLPSQCGTTVLPLSNQLYNNLHQIPVIILQKTGDKHQ